MIINFFGFAPFGIYIFWLSGARRSVARVTFSAIALSLAIEFGQVFFAGRHPSMLDLVLNALGALLGWLPAARFARLSSTPGSTRM